MAAKRPTRGKQRGNGEGTVSKRSDGRWAARISVQGADGKRRRLTAYGPTREAASAKLHVLQDAKRRGLPIEPGRLTVAQYLASWIKHVVTPRVRASTLRNYQDHTNRISTAAGTIPLRRWKPAEIRALWAQWESEGLGARTRQAVHVIARQALAEAVSDGILASNPFDSIRAPRVPTPTRRVLEPEQVRELLEAADAVGPEWVSAFVHVVALTGCRVSEAIGLKWADVDLDEGAISIRRAIAEVRGKHIEQETKTKAGRRTVTLPHRAVDRLRAHRQALGVVPIGASIVFPSSTGEWLWKTNLYRDVLRPLLIEAGLPVVGWHSLRHAHVTALLAAGEPVADVAARVGHGNPTTTLALYAHAIPSRARAIADRVESLLG